MMVIWKDGIVYDTDDDCREIINNLVEFFELLIEIDQKTKQDNSNHDELYLMDSDGRKIIL